jgi:hypothetical protein
VEDLANRLRITADVARCRYGLGVGLQGQVYSSVDRDKVAVRKEDKERSPTRTGALPMYHAVQLRSRADLAYKDESE